MGGVVSVAIGGALGAVARWAVGLWLGGRLGPGFPWPTFCINISGAFILALAVTLAAGLVAPGWMRLGFATGFVGAYTTFSTYIWEGLGLATAGQVAVGLLYLGGSVVLGLAAAWLGLALGQAILGHLVG